MNPENIPVEARPIAWVTPESGNPVIQFNVDWFKTLLQPGVYLIVSKTHMLYVGSAGNLLSRISSPAHQAVLNSLKEEGIDQIMMIPAKSRKHAFEIETHYIREFRPKYNIVGNTTNVEQLPDNLP